MENNKQVTTANKNIVETDASDEINTLRTAKKSYVLNDLEAIKKKLENAYRQPGIEIVTEAVDGSCVTIGVKTSLFEYFKENLLSTLMNDARVSKVDPVRKVTADTNFNGEASVEYQLEVDFAVDGYAHKVKILCFTTTCNIMIQNMGGRPEIKLYLKINIVQSFMRRSSF